MRIGRDQVGGPWTAVLLLLLLLPATAAGVAVRMGPKPFYAIAHRVLMDYGVRDALRHGANALEIDVQPWRDGWYADHDGTAWSAGHTAERMFRAVAEHRRAGWPVIFVWLDIKNPDWCDGGWASCNIEALRDLARRILEPAGVRVLYGFWADHQHGRGYRLIRDGLNANEAVALEGDLDVVARAFERDGPADVRKRVYSRGLFVPAFDFGDCADPGGSGVCPELRRAADSGLFGNVFGWTISADEVETGEVLMENTNVDGLIYGFVATHYHDDQDVLYPLSFLYHWTRANTAKRSYATVRDPPW
ncbi:hypothetical protein CDD83_3850 [Cordyceps sp. RAO-2017]|nr:hypothetical protein CDD83_3850 [Cordyceps sp. RAO-2017]